MIAGFKFGAVTVTVDVAAARAEALARCGRVRDAADLSLPEARRLLGLRRHSGVAPELVAGRPWAFERLVVAAALRRVGLSWKAAWRLAGVAAETEAEAKS